ncbi:hypothetical protein HYFRA_00004768 [Hymenoscyphus fraxineus]|uniref:Uncharacterized protein n=1 Tax=Hymenoscyphus fraxineus TaxID=746836 RepID=A0A9N9PJX0_9HELO|nr:hypothetical protein HYFRA_00004768 [Hymenoscyphus fraxineus]
MRMWPFRRRRSSRKQPHGGAPPSREITMHNAGTLSNPVRHEGAEITSSVPERRLSRRDQKRRASRESKKLKKRTYSFSPGRQDSIKLAWDAIRPPVPQIPSNILGRPTRTNSERDFSSTPLPKPHRSSTQAPQASQEWQRMPTLHKRSAQELAQRKSHKKRKEEHDREVEIKAMAAFMPTRPAAEPNSAGRLMKRESKRMRQGLNRNLQNPSSDISLPSAESMHSSLSSGSERQTSYKLSALDVLAPRPTIRYSENPRYAPGASGFGSDRSDSRRRRVSDRVTLDQEVMKANKRIDELADDLSAGELRELMERDNKRREKKKIAERIKMERKLAKKQAKQEAEEAAAVRNGSPPPANMERGVMGREVVGLGIGNSAVVSNSTKRKSSSDSHNGRSKRLSEPYREDSSIQGSSDNFHRSENLATKNLPQDDVARGEIIAKANMSPPLSPQSHRRDASYISQSMDIDTPSTTPAPPTNLAPPKTDTSRQSSESSLNRRSRGPSSWTSFFKRSKTKRETAPSSFSNTSRDSMQNVSFSKSAYSPRPSNVPKRTRSKFREDLPELPISPPDSRVQSPEADIVPPIRDYPERRSALIRSPDDLRVQGATPTSGHRSLKTPSPEPAAVLSQSLASIDSEGSWLSGRKSGSKRGSSQMQMHHNLHESASSLQKRYKEYSESAEEMGIAEDEYFSRLTPGPEEQFKIQRISTGNPMPSSDEEDGGSIASPVPSENTKWGAVARTPTVVHHETRAKSREGLLNDYEDSVSSVTGTDSIADSKRKSFGLDQVINEDGPGVQRATSVEYRSSGHARRISAGSARVLNLKPKVSEE